jgi:predicted chitinase
MLKIKQQNSNLVITNMGEASVVDISTLENAKKAIGMLTKAYEQVYFANQALKENVEATESYSIKGIEPLFADTFTNVPDTVTKAAKESLKFTPPLLQGLAVEKQAQLVMAVYNQLGNSLLQNSGVDTVTLAKSYLAKAAGIQNDLSLLKDQLHESVSTLKSIQLEKQLKKDIEEKAIAKGEQRTKAKYGTLNEEVLDTARSIVKAKELTAKDKAYLEMTVEEALKLARE